MTVLNSFPPLQGAFAYAESLKPDLDAFQNELRTSVTEAVISKAERYLCIGVMLGEWLPLMWKAAFNILLRPSQGPWQTVQEFENSRQEIRGLFHTVGEVMDTIRKMAMTLESLTGRKPLGMDRLNRLIEDARRLEEKVFRDWPSFLEPMAPDETPSSGGPKSVEESLAEALSITVEEARLKMDARPLFSFSSHVSFRRAYAFGDARSAPFV
jgi:hypothetical protein